jgi:hypothetical protein
MSQIPMTDKKDKQETSAKDEMKEDEILTLRQYLFDLCAHTYSLCSAGKSVHSLINLIQECLDIENDTDKILMKFLARSLLDEDSTYNMLFMSDSWPDLTKGEKVDFKMDGIKRLEGFKKFISRMDNEDSLFVEFYNSSRQS